MGVQRLQELSPYVKEALQKTAGVAKFLCLLHATGTYLCCGAKPVGPSMLPTFKDGDIVLAEKITSRRGKVGSGDAVLIRSPEDPTKVMTKRVKGVEGDVVSYALDPQSSDELKTVVVPKGHVWIEGDNLENSRDSRQFGPVPYALIHSRIFCVVWPPKDFGTIGNKVL
ncbi:mitochondrial inner membrane protease subunit 1 [Phtheirospermum japonicum]|uniref:Mitochondrial inner membrane protease subunit 1 n=1 Tax=Phtheirospermum japonicum TaxID=374723 RepID=A0A830C7M8_9LAMI|nr:mitochondrial inner membrane protease subunit 1 [Phtheirospermum japonicum]